MANILIVDDEKSIRKTLREILEYENYKVDEAVDGAQALNMLSEGSYDCALLDIKMPKMDGMELARKVTQAYPGAKILFISGYADEIVYAHQDLAGVSAFLPKPFDVEILLKRVRELVGR